MNDRTKSAQAEDAPLAPAASEPSSDARLPRARGSLGLSFRLRSPDGPSTLDRLAQRSPQRAFVHHDAGSEPVGILLNTAGGVCGGDSLETFVHLREGACATLTTQAAERIYRAIDVDAEIEVSIRLESGSRLHWAPQETLLFDGSRLRRCTTIRAAADGRIVASETLVFGRRAMRETIQRLRLRDTWRIVRDGRLVWADSLRLDGAPPAALAAASGLAGHEALSTIVVLTQDPERVRDELRAEIESLGLFGGATVVHGVLLARLVGSAAGLRAGLTHLLPRLRARVLEIAPSLPRVWAC